MVIATKEMRFPAILALTMHWRSHAWQGLPSKTRGAKPGCCLKKLHLGRDFPRYMGYEEVEFGAFSLLFTISHRGVPSWMGLSASGSVPARGGALTCFRC